MLTGGLIMEIDKFFSPFWKTRDLEEGVPVVIRRLGDLTPGEFRGLIRGVYACDVDGHPDAYIVELIDRIPNQKYSNYVFTRGCVDELTPIEVESMVDSKIIDFEKDLQYFYDKRTVERDANIDTTGIDAQIAMLEGALSVFKTVRSGG
jgi:hypothetical protein